MECMEFQLVDKDLTTRWRDTLLRVTAMLLFCNSVVGTGRDRIAKVYLYFPYCWNVKTNHSHNHHLSWPLSHSFIDFLSLSLYLVNLFDILFQFKSIENVIVCNVLRLNIEDICILYIYITPTPKSGFTHKNRPFIHYNGAAVSLVFDAKLYI